MLQNEPSIEYSYISGESNKVIAAHRSLDRKFAFCVAVSVLEGSYYVEIGGKRYVAQKGETVFVPCFVVHNVGMENIGKITYAHFSCFFLSKDLFNPSNKDCFIIKNSTFSNLLVELNSCNESKSLKQKLYTNKIITELLLELEKDNTLLFQYTVFDGKIIKVLNYIHSHIYEDISVDDLIKESGYHKTYFYKAFKNEVLMTPRQYIEQEKFKIATVLLTDNMKVSQIAKVLNFSDDIYFCKRFKKVFGVSPTRYRMILNNINGGI